jgi:hypothetical protein
LRWRRDGSELGLQLPAVFARPEQINQRNVGKVPQYLDRGKEQHQEWVMDYWIDHDCQLGNSFPAEVQMTLKGYDLPYHGCA